MKSTKQSGNEVWLCTEKFISVSDSWFKEHLFLNIYDPFQDKEWFAGDCNRKTAEEHLMRVNKVNQAVVMVPQLNTVSFNFQAKTRA